MEFLVCGTGRSHWSQWYWIPFVGKRSIKVTIFFCKIGCYDIFFFHFFHFDFKSSILGPKNGAWDPEWKLQLYQCGSPKSMDKLVFYSIQTKNLCDHIMQKTGIIRDWDLVKPCGEQVNWPELHKCLIYFIEGEHQMKN